MIRTDILQQFGGGSDTYSITPLSERRSSIFLTKFEIAKIVGERAKQIVNGTASKFFLQGSSGKDAAEIAERCTDPFSSALDPVMMAKHDLVQGKIPMIVQRTWPNGNVEYIPINELQVDPLMLDLNY